MNRKFRLEAIHGLENYALDSPFIQTLTDMELWHFYVESRKLKSKVDIEIQKRGIR